MAVEVYFAYLPTVTVYLISTLTELALGADELIMR